MVQQTNRSNNTNKYNPQEQGASLCASSTSSNNTNKYNPQEHLSVDKMESIVQIIRINTILKNRVTNLSYCPSVQIIRINTILKNNLESVLLLQKFK